MSLNIRTHYCSGVRNHEANLELATVTWLYRFAGVRRAGIPETAKQEGP